ncbi:hypothetical protein Dimus_009727 [Dionaea muscipula]
MEQQESNLSISITWRGMKFNIEINSGATLKELGDELQKLTDVKADTMRLIVPQSTKKSSKLLLPFSVEHSNLILEEIPFPEGKPIRMMGVSEKELDEVLEGAKDNLRIAGFEEDEKRMRMRMSKGPRAPLKLPQGAYIFCDFRTLELPGIELNPPASEALKRMHMLAADPGIVAIMNKHRWRVGIMTELAPVGYVGISPKCVLGFNKNHGEEISLRLRTDDLKGFRKYGSIKKTLLHELAHMVYSEHDANFHALNKQLNEEASTLDWTKSRGHTLGNIRPQEQYDLDEFEPENPMSYKLGGTTFGMLASARVASVAAAHHRIANSLAASGYKEPDPDDSISSVHKEANSTNIVVEGRLAPKNQGEGHSKLNNEPDPVDCSGNQLRLAAADPGNAQAGKIMKSEPYPNRSSTRAEPDPDDTEMLDIFAPPGMLDVEIKDEPDPDDSLQEMPRPKTDEPDPDDQELQRIQDPVTAFCGHLTKGIEMLRREVGPSNAGEVLRTILKIIRNVIEHPSEMKYKRIRKANPVFQRNVAPYKAAVEVLSLIGFYEDVALDETGKSETYLALKRDDPGLLWLAKSSLEMHMV